MDRAKRNDLLGAAFGFIVALPCMGMAITGAGVLWWQAAQWINTAVWPRLSLLHGLSWYLERPVQVADFATGKLGLDSIIEWGLTAPPLALWLIVGLPAIWIGLWIFLFNVVFPER